AEQEAEALARFDALLPGAAPGAAPSEPLFPNAATRGGDRVTACWRARDWDGFARMLSPGFHFDDRRWISQTVLDRAGYVAFTRQFADMASARIDGEYLATRGECLFLRTIRAEVADGDVGPSELEYLYLVETDEHGTWVAGVTFDMADIDAAYAELDRRYEAG